MSTLQSFYNGVSGMNAMSQKINVKANNVANINTTGFKTGQANFADIFESAMDANSAGNGVQLASINTSFTSGGLAQTNRSTDMAISGSGFFLLRNSDRTTADRYSRNGEFDLTLNSAPGSTSYNLTTPTGEFVQGYNLSATALVPPVAEDILINGSAPQTATSQIDVMVNLDSDAALIETSNTSLFDRWDGRSPVQPISPGSYEYQTTMKLYAPDDGAANPTATSLYADLNIYFDSTDKLNEKEFLVTCDPALDQRVIPGGGSYDATDKGAGALLYGILHFSTNGDLSDIQCWSVPPDGNVAPSTANMLQLVRGENFYNFDYNLTGTPTNNTSAINFGNIPKPRSISSPAQAYTTASASATANAFSGWNSMYDSQGNQVKEGDSIRFTGRSGDGTPREYTYTVDFSASVQDFLAGLQEQFGCTAQIVDGRLTLTDTEVGASQLAIDSITYTNAAGATPATNPLLAQIFGNPATPFAIDQEERYTSGPLATTSYASPSVTIYQHQDGTGRGTLENISVDTQGTISGHYSNGKVIPQAQLVLANFTNLQGLRTEGNNIFTASAEAGDITLGTADQGVFGTIVNNSLEMSNVDLGWEMTDLILTQRAFQANSKSITTTDEIYDTVLQLIRR